MHTATGECLNLRYRIAAASVDHISRPKLPREIEFGRYHVNRNNAASTGKRRSIDA